MAEQDQDRNERATPFKLEEARKRGSVAKSADMLALAVMAAAVLFIYWVGWGTFQKQLAQDQFILRQAGQLAFEPAQMMHWLQQVLVHAVVLIIPLFAAIALAAIVANVAQTGPVFSFQPLKPDFNRINPVTGLKRVFSMRTIYDALRSLLKVFILGGVLALCVMHLMPRFVGLLNVDPVAYGKPMLGEIAALLFKLLLAMLVIALLDLLYTRWEYAKQMRMSRREMKDEHKQREGDPRIRSRMKQLRMEMLKRSQSARKVKDADVVITNPTHLAVALRYRDAEMPAPQVLAKGAGDLALRMREIARRHGVPVVENRALARELFFQVGSDHYVPEKLYPAVARILVWVLAMRDARARAGTAR